MDTLPTPLQSYIHKSRYARWLDAEQRRETWAETVARYVAFFAARFPEHYPAERVQRAIQNLECMPSMRALMTAGPALAKDEMAGFNPVSAGTKVLTREYGLVPIEQLEGRCATVLNKDGRWTEATFRGYGVQPTKRVRFRRNSNTELHVDCTANHRWVLTTGEVKSTATLAVGDTIPHAAAPKPALDGDYLLGVRHGIIYGDGTALRSAKRVKGFAIRMCGDSAELLEYFEGYPRSYPPSFGGDPVVYMFDAFAATHDLKSLPADDESESYKLGFIRGLLAADGSVSNGSQVTLCGSKDAVDWLKVNGEQLGFIVQRVAITPSTTNFGERTRDTFSVHLHRDGLVPEDFLCSWKRANFRQLTSTYKVVGIEDNTPCPVYCAEVPDTNTFVLEGGIVTGNCSYIAVDNVRVFDEILYVLMCGTGVGFSVERQSIGQLPTIAESLHPSDTVIVVKDSKLGWASAFRSVLSLLYSGQIPKWDLSKIRPAGAKLKTFGGRASGPAPLQDLFEFATELFKKAAGRKLTSIECHDLVCKIADIVVVGGVRRSALISLSDLSDDRMRVAKSGKWWEDDPQRALANNSAVYTERPEMQTFLKEWQALVESKSGERGIFNRSSAKKKAAEHGRRDADFDFGTNPCGEILLRSAGLCNLTEVVIRAGDTLEVLRDKVEVATIMGTFQATLSKFRYVRSVWQRNQEEERLLGVSMTGIMDHELLCEASPTAEAWLQELRALAVAVNAEWAGKLGIKPAAAITTVKPSGTVSQLVDSASGIHPRYSEHYIRTVRADKKDPLAKFMRASGFPVEDCVLKAESTDVFSFPVEGPEHAVFRNDMTAVQQLDHYLMFATSWCEHNPSITVYVRDHEWLAVGDWVYKNFDKVGGVSFLPHSDHSYKQAPYQECSKDEYEALKAKMPSFDWAGLQAFEKEDSTTNQQTLACTAGACELL
jgi:ribonucleoside-diphosphate reductase alpha chain